MTEIKYKGEIIATLESNQKAVLHLKDKKLTGDIDIVAPAPVEEWDGSVVIEGGVEPINFTIDGDHYEAVDGITWLEWVESSYNTGGFYTNNTDLNIYTSLGPVIADGYYVKNTDSIVADKAYEIAAGN